MRRLISSLTLALLIAFLAPLQAYAADDVISFDSLADGAQVTEQLVSQGVDFGSPSDFGLGSGPNFGNFAYPSDAPSGCGGKPIAHSASPTTLRAVFCYTLKENLGGAHYLMFRLSTLRSKVTFSVNTLSEKPDTGFTVTAYDNNGALLAKYTSTELNTGFTLTTNANSIAYVMINRVNPFEIGPISVNHYDVPPTPFITFGSVDNVTVGQTGIATANMKINRWNGSNGAIGLAMTPSAGLDAATFTPAVLGGTAQNATIRVTGSRTSAPGSYTATINVTPQSGTAGTSAVTGKLNVQLEPRYTFRGSLAKRLEVPPCQQGSLDVGSIDWGPGVTPNGNIQIDYTTTLNGDDAQVFRSSGTIPLGTRLPVQNKAEIIASGNSLGTITARLLEGTTPLPGTEQETSVYVAEPWIEIYPTAFGYTPGPGRPEGSWVDVEGSLCPGAKIVVGNAKALAPVELKPAGEWSTRGRFQIPRLATSGPVSLVSKYWQESFPYYGGAFRKSFPTSKNSLTVSDYRDRSAFAWTNGLPGKGRHVSFDLMKRAFGNQVVAEVDACSASTFGLFSCAAKVGVPTVSAAAYIASDPSLDKGLCWGYSVLAERLMNDEQLWFYGPYPHPDAASGTRANSMLNNGEAGPSAPLGDDVIAAQLQWNSTEILSAFYSGKNNVTSVPDLIARWDTATADGRAPVVNVRIPGAGHALLATDLEKLPNGGVRLSVMNPNVPVLSAELTDLTGQLHAARHTAITIDAQGNWSSTAPDWTGNLSTRGSLDLFPAASIPTNPTWVSGIVGNFLLSGIGADDETGIGTVGAVSGTENASSPLTATSPSAMWVGNGLVRSARATTPGNEATAALAGEGVSVTGEASGVTLVATSTTQLVTATVDKTSKSDVLAPEKGGFALTHTGGPAAVQLTTYANGITLTSPMLKVTDGSTVSVKGSTVELRTKKGKKTRTKKVQLTGASTGPAPTLGKATAKVKGGKLLLTVPVTVPAGATGAVGWKLLSKKQGKMAAKGGGLVTAGAYTSKTKVKARPGQYVLVITVGTFDQSTQTPGGSTTVKKALRIRSKSR